MNLNKLSLKAKIISAGVFMVSLIALASFINLRYVLEETKVDADARIGSAAENLGERIAAQLFERYGDVQAFALNETVKTFNQEKINDVLDSYVALYGIYDVVLVVDRDGNYIGSNTKDPQGKLLNISALKKYDYKKESWFQNSLAEKFTNDASKNYAGTYIEDILMDPIIDLSLGERRLGSSFSSTIKNNKGEVIGVITNRANKKWFEFELTESFLGLKKSGYHRPEITLTNKEGLVISFITSNENTNEIVVIEDQENVLLKENFASKHIPAGQNALKGESGVSISRYDSQKYDDVVGYHPIENKKWIKSLGWIAFVHDSKEDSYAHQIKAENNFFFIMGSSLFIFIVFSIWFAVMVSKYINEIATHLNKNSKELHQSSVRIASSSVQLSESATEQAAALQETVAAVDEISAMVDKSAENANSSKNVSQNSKSAAERGKQVVSQMLTAIGQIDHSNEEIGQQMNESNQQLSEISKLINDIGNKTKVINEIVFQTKLLSFNASVEAARAGEYGKGFAVVAEEVGNLAQMSGSAAKDISQLIETSVHKVEDIVNETRNKVDRLMSDSKKRIQEGNDTANECNDSLDEILKNVEHLDLMVSEISVSSTEQATGIREISKAIGQLEVVTQQNTSVAQSSSVSAQELKQEADSLSESVETLLTFVHGEGSLSTVNLKDSSKSSEGFKSNTSHAKANVYSFQKKFESSNKKNEHKTINSKPPVETVKEEHSQHHDFSHKQAAGSEFVPSSNDPGFKE
ncbi:MAG TPA: methyl-accepting chemotaxis protein [Pseudobdellovibrionaceae bacterium]|nr:methyl-accepting chemotaxis protein [Pseudobdellovibrionaceae bacterium]